jgi:Fis family transcriptional regulator, factor for inversion stimulation protein
MNQDIVNNMDNNLDNETTPQLRDLVKVTVENYLKNAEKPKNLYQFMLEEIEEPLMQFLMEKTKGNQCEVTRILGIARGTVRKKLAQYDLL